MRRPLEIKAEEASVRSVVSLTSALETLSSMQIAKTKNKVMISNQFFDEVWGIYKQIRVDVLFNFGRKVDEKPIDKELLILITAKGGLSGDIDNKLIRKVVEHYDEAKNDVLVIGHHGMLKLKQSHIDHTYYFDLPERDYINVDPLMDITRKYAKSRIFYQHYISLSQQEIKDVDLSEVVSSKGRVADLSTVSDDLVTEKTYIFEPSSYAFSIDWGDGTPAELKSQPLAGLVNIVHTYKKAGIYTVNIRVTDANGVSAFLQVIAVASGKVDGTPAAPNTATPAAPKPEIMWIPTIVLLLLLLPTYWLGRRSMLVSIRNKMLKDRDQYEKEQK